MVGLAAQFVRDHGRLGLNGADDRYANALALNGFDQRTEIKLLDTYHTSRYNVNTGKLTPEMFDAVFKTLAALMPRG